VHCLLRRAALGVEGEAADLVGQPRVQPGGPGDVAGLLARLGDAAAGHLVNAAGLDARPLQQRGLRAAEDLGGVQAGQRAAALADRGPYRLDDDRSSHRSSSVRQPSSS
jgi:hypothetical protein